MALARWRFVVVARVAVAVGWAQGRLCFAQAPAEIPTVRDYCVKVLPSKGPEFEAFVRDVTMPLARARGEAGEFSWFLVASGVVPAGTSAPCDYRFVYGYKGDPPEAATKD